jgi:hypothetical protein
VRFSIEPPEARSWLAKQLERSLRFAAVEAIALALASMCLPDAWSAQGITFVGIYGGGIGTVLLYAGWGSASWLADIAVWATALLAGFGGWALQHVACGLMQKAVSAGLMHDVPIACAPNYLRASGEVAVLAILFVTFLVWVIMRYLTWKARRGAGRSP